MEVSAKLRYARISPQKCRLVADQIRGRAVAEALNTLSFSPKKGAKIVKKVLDTYRDDVRLVIRYMPLHPNSEYAAGALEAAAEQDRFWEMLDILFAYQPNWGDHHAPKPELIPVYADEASGGPTHPDPPKVGSLGRELGDHVKEEGPG